MANVLIYYAHPAQQRSIANKAMIEAARSVEGITIVDLYNTYPRFQINVDDEQQRLQDHDVILFQYPVFWYSSPSLVKEYLDLVLEYGFAYGEGGTALQGKHLGLALTAAGSAEAYSETGYQNFPLRDFTKPMEQTATLCGMKFLAPYTLFSSLHAHETDECQNHAQGYARYLTALRDDAVDLNYAVAADLLFHSNLPVKG